MKSLPEIEFRSDGSPEASEWAGKLRAQAVLVCEGLGKKTRLIDQGRLAREWDDPLEALRWMAATHGERDDRWCGFISYDLGRLFEKLPSTASDDQQMPLFAFARGNFRRDGVSSALSAPVATAGGVTPPLQAPIVRSTFSRQGFESAVQKSLDYIAAGDIFQVNLSQRFQVTSNVPPGVAFERLSAATPARYGALLQFEDYAIVSNSPELFLQVTADRRVITRPIKGTRPRSPGMRQELLNSVKDQAELNMIIDLERNDLGRVCEVGSVRVSEPRKIEEHPTVYHGVATVEGRLRDGIGLVELLRATFPGGSVTGAPKIRAMEIIEALEPVRRGAYCGAIGYLASDGSMQFNLAIRTMTFKDGMVYTPVGGGIVADSTPGAEYDETIVKSRAMFAALGIDADSVVVKS